MIPDYRDHAANERTFLAWVRTAISIMAFGFVIERLDLVVSTPALLPGQLMAQPNDSASIRLVGLLCAIVGIALLGLATFRFIRTTDKIASREQRSLPSLRLDLALTVLVSSIGIIMCLYVALRLVA